MDIPQEARNMLAGVSVTDIHDHTTLKTDRRPKRLSNYRWEFTGVRLIQSLERRSDEHRERTCRHVPARSARGG